MASGVTALRRRQDSKALPIGLSGLRADHRGRNSDNSMAMPQSVCQWPEGTLVFELRSGISY